MTESKHQVSAVYPKVRDAIAILLAQDKYDLPAAAAGAGMKNYLSRPSVRSYMRQQRQLQIETICSQNPTALAKLRDEGTNQVAVVNGIRTLEAMRRDAIVESTGPARREAGLVIVIGRDAIEPPPRLAGARTVESIAYERGPDPDDDALADDIADDEALAALPEPARVVAKPARRKSPGAAKARQSGVVGHSLDGIGRL